MPEAKEELKKLLKTRTRGKLEPICVFIKVREAVDIVDLQVKTEEGITTLRIHSTNAKFPKWYTHGYLIDIKNLRLTKKDMKSRQKIQEVLLNPNKIVHVATKQLIDKLIKELGDFYPDGMNRLHWKTEKFKKKKDPFKVKMKAM